MRLREGQAVRVFSGGNGLAGFRSDIHASAVYARFAHRFE